MKKFSLLFAMLMMVVSGAWAAGTDYTDASGLKKWNYSTVYDWTETSATTFHTSKIRQVNADGTAGTEYTMNNTIKWQIFASNQSQFTAPGTVLRYNESGKKQSSDAQFAPLTFGGLIVNALQADNTPYEITNNTTTSDRKVELGNGTYTTYFQFNKSFKINRRSATQFIGTVNVEVAEGAIFYSNSQSVGSIVNSSSSLVMSGKGTLNTPALVASGATLDFSSLELTRLASTSTNPFIDAALTVSETTVLKMPAGTSTSGTYKIAKSIASAVSATGIAVYIGGESKSLNVTYKTDGTVTFSEEVPANIISSGETKKVSEITGTFENINVKAGGTLIVDQATTLPIIGAGAVKVNNAVTCTFSDLTSFTGTLTVDNSGADVTVAGTLSSATLACKAGSLKYSGTNITGCTLEGVTLTGNNYVTVAGTNTIKNLAGNDLTSGGSFNYAIVGAGTLNFEGTCDLTKKSTGAAQGNAKIGMGSDNSIVVKSGANLTASYILNTVTSNNNAAITVEDGATLTAQDLQTTTLSNSGTVTLNGTVKCWTALYAKKGTINLNGTNSEAVRVELSDVQGAANTTTLNIKEGSTFTVTGSSDDASYKTATVILGEWEAKTIVNCNGTFKIENASIQPGDTGFELNIGANGKVQAKGLGIVATGKSAKTQAMAVNITEGGVLEIGSTGIVTTSGTTTKNIAYTNTITRGTATAKYGTICLPAGATVEGAVLLSLTDGVVEDGNLKSVSFDYAKVGEEEGSETTSTVLTAGTPYLYRATADTQKFTVSGNYTAAKSVNGLVGTLARTEIGEGKFIFATIDGVQKIYKVAAVPETTYTNVWSGEFKAYINPTDIPTASEARGAATFFVYDDATTGLQTIDFQSPVVRDGKFVQNGRVVIVKNGVKFNAAGQTIK